jgi:acetyl-CoA acyltransferase
MDRTAVVVDAVRSPMAKGRPPQDGRPGGALSGVHPVELLAQTFRALLSRQDFDPGMVDDVIVGCVTQIGEQGYIPGRMAWLAAGLPDHVPSVMIDRRCGSSQQAVDFAAQAIIAGAVDIVVAGGVESMSRVRMGSARAGVDAVGPSTTARYSPGLIDQGVSAELVAAKYAISRDEMDAYAARSHARATQAIQQTTREIVPISGQGPDGDWQFTTDETIRADTTIDSLARLRPAFQTAEAEARFPEISWSVTAGNSSQITDGASAVLLMNEQTARSLDLVPRARIVGFGLAADDPLLMLTGPIPATEKLLRRTCHSIADIDHFEVNEAFASVPLAWQRHFNVDPNLLNPRGGAIALGHPLGASGARLLTTMINALESNRGRYGLQTMCEAGGTANATLIERL